MAQKWQVEPATGRCAITGRTFEEGDEFHTVLVENGEIFTRVDYSVDAWKGPPDGAFCHFKTRVPVKEKRKKLLVDGQVIEGFFRRLAQETEPVRVHFRFVLALILMRKRLLRYEGSSIEEGAEVWRMTFPRESEVHRVVNPRLSDEQIEDVSQQLGAILHSDMGEWTDSEEDSSVVDPDQQTDPDAPAEQDSC